MNPGDVPIPERLKAFPLYKGFLVHFTVWVGDNGVPDFRVVHEANRRRCMEEEWCSLCGQPLEKPLVFIGGPLCVEKRLFVDGPMHEDCALYAARTCPFLADPAYQDRPLDSSIAHALKDGAEAIDVAAAAPGRPARMALVYVNRYRLILDQPVIYFQIGPPLKVDWDTMPKRS